MNDEPTLLVAGLVVGILIGAFAAYNITTNHWRRDAIRNGVAHYVSPGPDSSERNFQWKTNTVVIKP